MSPRFLALLVFVACLFPAVARADFLPKTLQVSGFPDAYCAPPTDRGAGRVVVYLHARGGNPRKDCETWARVVRPFAWTLCPQGPGTTPSGGRTWNNDAVAAEQIADAALDALRAAHPRRIHGRGNVLIGFSEGAFVLQQVGMHDPARWSRWFVLAASDRYWDGQAVARLEEHRELLRRVFLLTGDHDQVAGNTRIVEAMLEEAHVPVRMRIVPGLGHELAAHRMRGTYRKPLEWLLAVRSDRHRPES